MARLTHEQRHQQILDTAIDLFAKFGFRGTTTKKIAQAAGVSEATIFLHFPSKESLYEAILEEKLKVQRPLTAFLDGATDAPLGEVLERVASSLVERHHKDVALLRLALFSALEHHTIGRRLARQHIDGPMQSLTRVLERAKARGEVREDLDPETAARAFASMLIHQILAREIFGEDHVSLDDMRSYVNIYLGGISPRNGQEA
jgi:AcrR family transcriptional regulator